MIKDKLNYYTTFKPSQLPALIFYCFGIVNSLFVCAAGVMGKVPWIALAGFFGMIGMGLVFKYFIKAQINNDFAVERIDQLLCLHSDQEEFCEILGKLKSDLKEK